MNSFFQVEYNDGDMVCVLEPTEDQWDQILFNNPNFKDEDYDNNNLDHVKAFSNLINNSYIVKITRTIIKR